MRRVAITAQSSERTCLALFRRQEHDDHPRVAQWIYNSNRGGWAWEHGDALSGATYGGPLLWPFLFTFGDGSFGLCRTDEVAQALATCGLRLTEGGE